MFLRTVLKVYEFFFSSSSSYHRQKVLHHLGPTGLGIEEAGVEEKPRHLKDHFLLDLTWCQATGREEDKNVKTQR